LAPGSRDISTPISDEPPKGGRDYNNYLKSSLKIRQTRKRQQEIILFYALYGRFFSDIILKLTTGAGKAMKYYEQLMEKGCFTWHDVSEMVGNRNSAGDLIQDHLKKGYIQSVKRNLSVAINLADGKPVVNRYVLAGNLTKSAYM
jgi:hypothetical protein